MSRPMWFVEIIKHYFPDRFAIAEHTKKSYLYRKLIDFLLFDGDEIYYLPIDSLIISKQKSELYLNTDDDNIRKVSLISQQGVEENIGIGTEIGVQKVPINEIIVVSEPIDYEGDTVLPSEVVKYFIRKANYHWIMNKCICRDSNHCENYPINLGCIFLGEAVKGINPKLGRMVTDKEALEHIQRAADLGMVHMIGRNKIDTQWMGIGPGFKLMSICNCCPCCCLYKVLPNLEITIRSKVTKMPGVEVSYNKELCSGCAACVNVCITNNLKILQDKIEMGDVCIGCGRCVDVCPTNALTMSINDPEYIQKTINRLNQVVDVT